MQWLCVAIFGVVALLIVLPVIKQAKANDDKFKGVIATAGKRHSVKINSSSPYDIIQAWATENGFTKHSNSTPTYVIYSDNARIAIPTYLAYDGSTSTLEMWLQAQGVCQSIMEGPKISFPHNRAKKSFAKLMERLG